MRANDEVTAGAATVNVAELRPRERQAQTELGTTTIAPGTRTMLVVLFLAIIVAVPIYETIADVYDNYATRKRMVAEGVAPELLPGRRPHILDILSLVPRSSDIKAARSVADVRNLVPRPAAIREFENNLQLRSSAGKLVRPWFQALLTDVLGAGNSSVVIARDGYMYYADGLKYSMGSGFLDAERLRNELANGNAVDPRPVIFQLHDALKALGVQLIVLPLPDKSTIHPNALAANLQVNAPLQNSSWPQFVRDLRAHDVTVVDPTQALFDAERRGVSQYLPRDTHWNADGVNTGADVLMKALDSLGIAKGNAGYTSVAHMYDRTQDLVALLDLPRTIATAQNEHMNLRVSQIRDRDGKPWTSDSSSDVMFVGDSFFELYSSYPNEEKAASGFVEQMSYRLQRSIDRHASQTFGTYDTRTPLGKSLKELAVNMRGKKVVVWEFAMRKLVLNGWPLLPNEPVKTAR